MDDGSDNRVDNAFQIVSIQYRNQQVGKFEIGNSYIYTNEMSYNLRTDGRTEGPYLILEVVHF